MAQALTLEGLLTAPAGFGLANASRLQRAICRAADGLPLDGILSPEECAAHFGCKPEELVSRAPVIVEIVAGVRSGKSLIAGAAALKSALTADLSQLMPHEIARVAIVAPTVDNATATFRLLVGAMMASKMLSALLVGKPKDESFLVKRADGRIVEIIVVAAHRGAVTLRSRWLAGFVLDEVALFGVEQTGAAVNAEELLRAGETRLVKGAQGWLISSPFGPQGLLFNLWREGFGKPGRMLVVHAPTLAMNSAFDPEMVEAIRRRDPDAAAREYDAAWTDADIALIPSQHVDAAQRSVAELPPEDGLEYAAAMDPATRRNAWTLVIATRKRIGLELRTRQVIVYARQWVGSRAQPLDPDKVLKDIARILKSYRIRTVWSDQFSSDALRAIARRHGINLAEDTSTAARKVELFTSLRDKLADEAVELPPDPVLRSDLISVRKRITADGIKIDLPKTADGRHADYAPAVAMVLDRWVKEPPIPRNDPKPGTREYALAEAARFRKEAEKRAAKRNKAQSKALLARYR